MPSRPLLFDFGCRNATVCRSCLLSIRQQPAVAAPAQAWVASFSSTATRRARTRTRTAPKKAPMSTDELNRQFEELKLAGLANASKENANFSVRYFDQQGQNRHEVPEDDPSITPETALKFGFENVKAMVPTADARNALDEVIHEIGVDWKNIKTEEDVVKFKAQMQAYAASIDTQIEQATADMPRDLAQQVKKLMGVGIDPVKAAARVPQISEEPWTPNQRKKIAKLNFILRRLIPQSRREGGLTKTMIAEIYKAYSAARPTLAHGWANVPLDVWELLWDVFATDESVHINRLMHISQLSRDMSEAKVTLSPAQQLLTIEAVFVDGWETRALDNWRRCVATLGLESSETFQDFWELGVRMYCRVGDLEQAERAVNRLLVNNADPRIMVPVIRTFSEQGTPEGHKKAWNAYRRMRQSLGQSMKIEDYDQVISIFLTANQIENALYAFVDMMSDGEIDLKKQKYLPSVVANKFFVGKWLKRLIGAGDLEGAYSVVEFMSDRGVAAAPIHLNGLIGAWHRSGLADSIAKADELGWKMIESRISFVKSRDSVAVAKAGQEKKPGPAEVPRANLETFSLLAENYRVRGLHERLAELWDAFRAAKISPDVFIVNQLLESYIQTGQIKEALQTYETLIQKRGMAPDPYTFSALWKTIAVNRLYEVSQDHAAEARALFKEMITHKSAFPPEGMDGQLARKILHSFRQLQDNAGFLVALTTLKDVFNFVPSETLVLEMMLGTTKISWNNDTHRRRLMTAKRELDRELLASVGGNAQALEGERRVQALYEFLQKQFWPEEPAGESVGKMLGRVANEMGVYDLLSPKNKN
ncbi:pentatricopeptide repeat-containing protein [Stachybotrys elegans]|uniref:Pentatricopeptide repeat-containing protein n=1 Tax=Stachybotrys elegans TaxID=80388 RepID=A0A8K0SU34_9HYPO|nr:pentatricopeptide repeat-containing protein [Stachybotrys elegans]